MSWTRAMMFNSMLAMLLVLPVLVPVVGAADESRQPTQPLHPQVLVEQTTDNMLAALKKHKQELDANPDLIYDLVKEIAVPHFDFIRMSRWVLGKYWRTASKEQKLDFVRAFRTLMIKTYGVALLDYTNQKIKYLPLRDDLAREDVTVKTQVLQSGKQPVTINYSLALRKGEWKVYDVTVDGISLISNFRTSFASEIKESSLDALIARLQQHNQQKINQQKSSS